MDNHVEQNDGRQSKDQEAELQERFQKDGYAWHCLQRGGSFDVSETTASPYLKLACLTWINSSYLDASSDVSL